MKYLHRLKEYGENLYPRVGLFYGLRRIEVIARRNNGPYKYDYWRLSIVWGFPAGRYNESIWFWPKIGFWSGKEFPESWDRWGFK